jgi:UDP-N-acetyl-D-glucosamine dehydrogenase
MLTSMRVAIIGQGYVGLTISVGAFGSGHKVFGIESNEKLVTKLNAGLSHIEGISAEKIKAGIASGSYLATSDFSKINQCEVVVIAVPTPLDKKGEPDISILQSAVASLAPFLSDGALVINESTSYIGTLRKMIAEPIMAINPKVVDFAVSPERVDPGNARYGLANTPRLVGGTSKSATDRAVAFYESFSGEVVRVSSPEVAEAAKLLENSFRFINIGFINEFSQVMNSLGVPAIEVIQAAATKPYGFMPFTPNVGIGGHCIPVDPLYLQKNAKDSQSLSRYIELSEQMNQAMPEYCVDQLEKRYGSLKDKHLLLIGVSYKADISDTRESPAEAVIEHLESRGAKVSWHDPLVESFLSKGSSPIAGDYDLAWVLVNHSQLSLKGFGDKPIYCVNRIESEPDWIPILGNL